MELGIAESNLFLMLAALGLWLSRLPGSVEKIYQAGGIAQVIASELAARGIVPD